MSDRPSVNKVKVEEKLAEFGKYLAPEYRDRIFLTDLYRVQQVGELLPHWPSDYGVAFRSRTGDKIDVRSGVYMHFDHDDLLLYVGMAVCIGTRLGAYFQYAVDRTCKIRDDLKESCGVRVVPLDEDISFLTPALELWLIRELNPPVNKKGRRHFVDT